MAEPVRIDQALADLMQHLAQNPTEGLDHATWMLIAQRLSKPPWEATPMDNFIVLQLLFSLLAPASVREALK